MVEKLSTEDAQKVENDLQSKDLFSFSREEIKKAFKKAKLKTKKLGFKLLQASTDKNHGKILVITPRRSGPAYKRNLIRRRVKEIFYREKLYKDCVISILIVEKKAMELNFEEIKKFLVDNL